MESDTLASRQGVFQQPARERLVRRTLRALCRQRVALILQPGNVWVIEKAMKDTPETGAALRTCALRGWVEVIENAIPSGQLNSDGTLPSQLFSGVSPIYKVTDSGWSVVHRTQLWLLVSLVISALSFLVSVLACWVALHPAGDH
jgi:hypothetical protein